MKTGEEEMKTSIRKAFYLGILVLFVVAIASIIVGFANADSGCSFDQTVCFENETNSKYIGSYQVTDSNGRIVQSNQWKNAIDLFFNSECVYLPWDTKATFYSNWDKNWIWEEKIDLFGDSCYKLKK